MSCSVYKLGGVGWEVPIAARGLAGHQSASGEQLHCASLVFFLGFYFSLFLLSSFSLQLSLLLLYFILVIKLFLSQPVSFTFFPDSPPHPTGIGRRSERVAAWCLVAGWA